MEGYRPQKQPTRYWIILVIIVAIGAYALGKRQIAPVSAPVIASAAGVSGIGSAPPSGVATSVEFKQFWEFWTLLKTKFYKQPLDEQKMLYGAMEGLAASTGDPYTTFFVPEVAKEFAQSLEGKFEGIGAEIGIKNDQLQVIAPLPESPAEKSGVLAGDAILNIDASSTAGMSVEEAVSRIRGKKGTTVTLTIGRMNGKTPTKKDISIVRDTIVVKSVKTKTVGDTIAYIAITNFNQDTNAEFVKAVDAAIEANAKGVILDLRNDPGGFLDRATAVAGEWVGDQVVVMERRQGEIVDTFHGTGSGRLKKMPTVILVNGGSASASEIVAGALQDYGLAQLIGEKTFGKGSVQDYTELVNGTAAKITIAEWLTPKQRAINEIGIDPDFTVPMTADDVHAERDPQLDAALEYLRTGTVRIPTATSTSTE